MRIDVTPSDPNPDTELHIRLLDLPSGGPVPGYGTHDGTDPVDPVNAAGAVLSHPTAAAAS